MSCLNNCLTRFSATRICRAAIDHARLRRLHHRDQIPIIALTATLALSVAVAGREAKADGPAPFKGGVTTAPPPAAGRLQTAAVAPAEQAPSADKTGGFDGNRAYAQVAKQVSFGPRPSGSPAIAQMQDYLLSELKSYGCTTDVDSFTSPTPAGNIPMKNILVKIPGQESAKTRGQKPGIILLGTHYDTKRLPNFVGADDAGSSACSVRSAAATPSGSPSSTARKPFAHNGKTPITVTAAAKWPRASPSAANFQG